MLDPTLLLVISLCMCALFTAASVHKFSQVDAFRRTLADYQLLPPALIPLLGVLIPTLEVCLAILWLAQRAPTITALVSAGLLTAYCLAIAINLWRGRVHISCGCGFPGVTDSGSPISASLVYRNSLLIAVALLSLLPSAPRELIWIDYAVTTIAMLAFITLYSSVSQLLETNASIASWRN
jgi:hypothetical protein